MQTLLTYLRAAMALPGADGGPKPAAAPLTALAPRPWPAPRYFSDRGQPCRAQTYRPQQVVRHRVPQRDGLGLEPATHRQLPQAAVAGLRVDTLRRRRPILVDRLRRLRRHPRTPGRHHRAVAGMGSMTIRTFLFGLGHRRVHHTTLVQRADGFDIVVRREATID